MRTSPDRDKFQPGKNKTKHHNKIRFLIYILNETIELAVANNLPTKKTEGINTRKIVKG